MGWQPGPGGGQGASPDRGPGTPGGAPSARDPRLAWFASGDGRDAIAPSGPLALAADQLSGPDRRCPGATSDEMTGLLRAFAAVESWASGAKLGVIAEMIRRDDAPRHGGGCHGDLPDEWSPSLRHELALALACSVQSAETTVWLSWELRARLPGTGALLGNGTLTLPKASAVAETFRYLTDADAATAEALILGQLEGKTYTQVLRLAEQAALTVDPQLAERRRAEAQKRNARVTFFREQSGTAGLSGRDLPPDEALAAMAAVNARAQQYEDSAAFGATPLDALRAYAYLDLLKGTPAEDRIACARVQDEAADAAEALAWANASAARARAQAAAGPRTGTGSATEAGTGSATEAGTGSATEAGDNASPGSESKATAAPAPAGTAPARPEEPTGTRTPPDPRAGRPEDTDARDNNADTQASPCDCPCGECDGDCSPGDSQNDHGTQDADDCDGNADSPDDHGGNDEDDDEPGDGSGNGGPRPGGPGPGGPRPGGPRPGGPGPAPGAPLAGRALQRPPDLTVPLLTLLGMAERPGEIQGFGLLDPALARAMAVAAAASPRAETCVTVTSPEGYAVGHGCARPDRSRRSSRTATPRGTSPAGIPARLNVTIPATALTDLARLAALAGGDGSWAFPPRPGTSPPGGTDPPDGYGTWTLTIPGGRRFTVRLNVVPTFGCDHRYETPGYHPGARLRHLVQVRDGTCT